MDVRSYRVGASSLVEKSVTYRKAEAVRCAGFTEGRSGPQVCRTDLPRSGPSFQARVPLIFESVAR